MGKIDAQNTGPPSENSKGQVVREERRNVEASLNEQPSEDLSVIQGADSTVRAFADALSSSSQVPPVEED